LEGGEHENVEWLLGGDDAVWLKTLWKVKEGGRDEDTKEFHAGVEDAEEEGRGLRWCVKEN